MDNVLAMRIIGVVMYIAIGAAAGSIAAVFGMHGVPVWVGAMAGAFAGLLYAAIAWGKAARAHRTT